MEERCKGYVRAADMIDIKRLDEQLDKHINRLWAMENDQKGNKLRVTAREDWEIDPDKLLIKQPIARGAFGTVHRGLYNGKDIAVKVLNWEEEGQRTEAKIVSLWTAFRQEVSVWHKLDHPNVVKFIGATMDTSALKTNGTRSKRTGMPSINGACVLIEYLPRGTLKSYLIKNMGRKLPFKIVIRLALDLARGLDYLHSMKVVHRDIKTENMLLDKNLTLKITDFGVARFQAMNPNEMTGNTGTPGYMAPEVMENEPYDRKCDVYSFGICLWEIYCCDMPYAQIRSSDLASSVLYQNMKPEIPRCCPSSLAQVITQCWDPVPNKRPDMKEVVNMLEAIDTSKGRGMTPLHEPQGCLFSCCL
ncbi:serine/threonine-protein kinase STY13-like [Corylus avellana]|uniref:serine/threonine-protein kinase STY13-like n=1 Tax=Corylus avellana TaxID=13451 RepID=UPI00286B39AF|nr:serine/threonine-protein kinase STY13-like [Corylus avellana]